MSKRSHTPMNTVSSSDSEFPRTPKAARTASRAPSLFCSLPPTCHPPNPPTPLSGTRALELHYAKYHAHVCEVGGCGCIFPDARLLELHLTECHDPLAEVRKERGEKIFACHLASCARMFSTPKTRRLHLISAHGFPKEYFFAVTNKGFGGLLRKWGEGASMLRGTWKPREGEGGDDDDEGDDENVSDAMEEEGPSTSAKIATNGKLKPAGPVAAPLPVKAAESSVDALASSMSSLSLVPSSVRFGRGGKSGGLAPPRGHPRGGAPVSRPAPAQATSTTTHSPSPHTKGEEALPSSTAREDAMNEDTSPSVARPQPHVPKDPRGRGRGRGRGGGFRGGVARGFVPPPPRGGFLAATRGRAVALSRGRGRGLA